MLKRLLSTGITLGLLAAPALALPNGPTVISGGAKVNSQGSTMQIIQNSSQAIINWNGFSIAPGELVQFIQSGANAAVLNRVTGSLPSNILGTLKANGQVFLLNPNGIFVGPGGVVDTAAFLASTLSMGNQDFLNKNYHLTQDPSQPQHSVVNQGSIHVNDGGMLVLVAPLVSNEGMLVAHLGTVTLAGTQEATISFDNRGLINFALPTGTQAPAGNVVLSPAATSALLGSLFPGPVPSGTLIQAGTIDVSGAQAGSVNLQSQHATALLPSSQILAYGDTGGGVKVLSQGTAILDGKIDASGTTQGGNVELSAPSIELKGQVNVGSSQGKSGNFLIDPATIDIVPTSLGSLDSSLPSILAGTPDASANTVSVSALASQTGAVTLQATGGVTVDNLNGTPLVFHNGVSVTLESISGGVNFINPNDSLVTHGGSINIFSGGAGSTLGQLFALQGGNINVQAAGAVHYTTLVAQQSNGSGGTVSVTASGDISPNPSQVTIPTTLARNTAAGAPGTTVTVNVTGQGIGASSVSLVSTGGSINTPIVAADSVYAQAPGSIAMDLTPGTLDSGGNPTQVGGNGTTLTALAGGNLDIFSKNSLVLVQLRGQNVNVFSATGSLVGLFPTQVASVTSLGNTNLAAPQGFVGTSGNPVTVDVGGTLSVQAGSQSNGISGILLGRSASGFIDFPSAPGTILFNPTDSLFNPQVIAMDNPFIADYLAGYLTSDEFLTAGSYMNSYATMMQFLLDPDDWRKFFGKQVVWEDEGSDAPASP